jgi:hypothetical protein
VLILPKPQHFKQIVVVFFRAHFLFITVFLPKVWFIAALAALMSIYAGCSCTFAALLLHFL